ncbi:glutaredoxin 2 [Vibrio navarrensis]|nr:glutaredoxin 2 [Vibrio navarrensis]EJL6566463.1 glutaredoxin 2 [Vibrio navarrensis]
MKLYIYEHCPFSARVRFVAGMLGLKLEVETIDYDDDETTTELVGSKQVPVLVKDNGVAIAESLDIIQYLLNLAGSAETQQPANAVLEWQSSAFLPLQKIGYPRWSAMDLREFRTDSAKRAWRAKKETEALNFAALLADTGEIATQVEVVIQNASELLKQPLTVVDQAVIFSILRGFFSAPQIQWENSVLAWMQFASEETSVSLLK